MSEETITIPQTTLPNVSMDYSFLREEGVKYLQELSGKLWTDYNAHDPGLTALEVLCYAITDLGYRTNLDMKDLLTVQGTGQQNFHTIAQIGGVNPLTELDYRKMLYDSPLVRSGWLEKVTQRPRAMTQNIQGLYRVHIELDEHDDYGDLNDNSMPINNLQINASGTAAGVPEFVDVEVEFPSWENIPEALDRIASVTSLTVTYLDIAGNDFMLFADLSIAAQDTNSTAFTVEMPVKFRTLAPLTDIHAIQSYKSLLKTALDGRTSMITDLVAKRAVIRNTMLQVRDRLHSNRNLCEDFLDIQPINLQEIGLDLQLEVTPGANLERVLSEVYFQVDKFISPQPKFRTLKEMLDLGHSIEEIFRGPALDNGFLDDEEVSGLKRKDRLFISDLVQEIMNVKDVLSVRKIAVANYFQSQKVAEDSQNCLNLLNPQVYLPRFSILKCETAFVRDGQRPVTADRDMVEAKYDELKALYRVGRKSSGTFDLVEPEGEFSDAENYYSIQHDFPLGFGMGANGIPAGSSPEKIAKIRQFKGFQLFFEQIIGNYLSQLGRLRDFFSYENTNTETYFQQVLSGVPDVSNLFTGLESYAATNNKDLQIPAEFNDAFTGMLGSTWDDLVEDDSTFHERRSRVFDHLLGRFSESLTDYALYVFENLGESTATWQEVLRAKSDYLLNFPALSSARATGPDRRKAPNEDPFNISGLKRNVATRLGVNSNDVELFAKLHNILTITGSGPYGYDIHDGSSNALMGTTSNTYATQEAATEAAQAVIKASLDMTNYTIGATSWTLQDESATHSVTSEETSYANATASLAGAEEVRARIADKLEVGSDNNLNLSNFDFYVSTSGGTNTSSFTITDGAASGATTLMTSVASDYADSTAAKEAADRTLSFGRDRANYTIVKDSTNYYYAVVDPTGTELAKSSNYSGASAEADANSGADAAVAALTQQTNFGFHLIEGVMLRPKVANSNPYYDPYVSTETITNGSDPDTYKYRITISGQILTSVKEYTSTTQAEKAGFSAMDNARWPDNMTVIDEGSNNFSVAILNNSRSRKAIAKTGNLTSLAAFTLMFEINELLMPLGHYTGKYSCLSIDDPYSFRITVVCPAYAERSLDPNFRRLFRKVLREETPAHILLNFKWASDYQLNEFESAYKSWADVDVIGQESVSYNSSTLKSNLEALVEKMNNPLKNYYEAYYTFETPKFYRRYQDREVLATVTDPDGDIIRAQLLPGYSLPSGVVLNEQTGTLSVDLTNFAMGDDTTCLTGSVFCPGATGVLIRTINNHGEATIHDVAIVLNDDSEATFTLQSDSLGAHEMRVGEIQTHSGSTLIVGTFSDADGSLSVTNTEGEDTNHDAAVAEESADLPEAYSIVYNTNIASWQIQVTDQSKIEAGDFEVIVNTKDQYGGTSIVTAAWRIKENDYPAEVIYPQYRTRVNAFTNGDVLFSISEDEDEGVKAVTLMVDNEGEKLIDTANTIDILSDYGLAGGLNSDSPKKWELTVADKDVFHDVVNDPQFGFRFDSNRGIYFQQFEITVEDDKTATGTTVLRPYIAVDEKASIGVTATPPRNINSYSDASNTAFDEIKVLATLTIDVGAIDTVAFSSTGPDGETSPISALSDMGLGLNESAEGIHTVFINNYSTFSDDSTNAALDPQNGYYLLEDELYKQSIFLSVTDDFGGTEIIKVPITFYSDKVATADLGDLKYIDEYSAGDELVRITKEDSEITNFVLTDPDPGSPNLTNQYLFANYGILMKIEQGTAVFRVANRFYFQHAVLSTSTYSYADGVYSTTLVGTITDVFGTTSSSTVAIQLLARADAILVTEDKPLPQSSNQYTGGEILLTLSDVPDGGLAEAMAYQVEENFVSAEDQAILEEERDPSQPPLNLGMPLDQGQLAFYGIKLDATSGKAIIAVDFLTGGYSTFEEALNARWKFENGFYELDLILMTKDFSGNFEYRTVNLIVPRFVAGTDSLILVSDAKIDSSYKSNDLVASVSDVNEGIASISIQGYDKDAFENTFGLTYLITAEARVAQFRVLDGDSFRSAIQSQFTLVNGKYTLDLTVETVDGQGHNYSQTMTLEVLADVGSAGTSWSSGKDLVLLRNNRQFVNVGDTLESKINPTNPWSFLFLVNISNEGGGQFLMSNSDGVRGVTCTVDSGGYLEVIIRNSSKMIHVKADGIIPFGTWLQIGIAYDGTVNNETSEKLDVFVNGQPITMVPQQDDLRYAGSWAEAPSTMAIFGDLANPTLSMGGRANYVGIWSRALTAQEMSTAYNLGAFDVNPAQFSDLFVLYTFDTDVLNSGESRAIDNSAQQDNFDGTTFGNPLFPVSATSNVSGG